MNEHGDFPEFVVCLPEGILDAKNGCFWMVYFPIRMVMIGFDPSRCVHAFVQELIGYTT